MVCTLWKKWLAPTYTLSCKRRRMYRKNPQRTRQEVLSNSWHPHTHHSSKIVSTTVPRFSEKSQSRISFERDTIRPQKWGHLISIHGINWWETSSDVTTENYIMHIRWNIGNVLASQSAFSYIFTPRTSTLAGGERMTSNGLCRAHPVVCFPRQYHLFTPFDKHFETLYDQPMQTGVLPNAVGAWLTLVRLTERPSHQQEAHRILPQTCRTTNALGEICWFAEPFPNSWAGRDVPDDMRTFKTQSPNKTLNASFHSKLAALRSSNLEHECSVKHLQQIHISPKDDLKRGQIPTSFRLDQLLRQGWAWIMCWTPGVLARCQIPSTWEVGSWSHAYRFTAQHL